MKKLLCIFCLAPALAWAQSSTDIPVHFLTPQPIQITPDQLPAPYATSSAAKSPKIVPPPANAALHVPTGFRVSVFARELDHPRWLTLSLEGDVLVTETPRNRILRLRDVDHDGISDSQGVFANESNGLNRPFGMAFAGDYVFIGNTDSVLRFPYTKGQAALKGRGTKIADLPSGGGHWTRNLIVSPDGQWLYVSVGSASNADPEPAPRATILRMKLDGTQQSVFASGLRNPVGLAFHPTTATLYTTVQERDGLGDDLVPDYLTSVRENGFYGWPYSYLTSARLDPRRVTNGQSEKPELAAQTITPDVLFAAHSSSMAVAFAQGDMFPAKYRNGAFVAFRGSWNRNTGTGYKLVFVPFDQQNKPMGNYEDFLTGFLIRPEVPEAWGRPVGLVFLPDGSLLFTEEENGRIYRVYYQPLPAL